MIKNTGEKIKKIRELKNLSREYLARELGITERAYQKIESEETKLTIDRLNEIGEVLEVSPLEILGFEPSLIFNNHSKQQSGGEYKYIAYYNNEGSELQKLYEKLLKEKDEIISLLKEKKF